MEVETITEMVSAAMHERMRAQGVLFIPQIRCEDGLDFIDLYAVLAAFCNYKLAYEEAAELWRS